MKTSVSAVQKLLSCIFPSASHRFEFSGDISERNNDYSDALDFRRRWERDVEVVKFFVLEVRHKFAMLIYRVAYSKDNSCYDTLNKHYMNNREFIFMNDKLQKLLKMTSPNISA